MNKQELVKKILTDKNNDFDSKASVERAIKAVLEGIPKGIKSDGSVQLIGFGTFSIKKRAGRTGRNP